MGGSIQDIRDRVRYTVLYCTVVSGACQLGRTGATMMFGNNVLVTAGDPEVLNDVPTDLIGR